MSDDRLVSALRAAIRKARDQAEGAADRHGLAWVANDGAVGGSWIDGTIERRGSMGAPMTELWDTEGGYVVTTAEAGSHIAGWDPASVLRLCDAADRILARHRADDPAAVAVVDGRRVQFCRYCRHTLPCADLRDLASAFGVSTEGATDDG